MPRLVRRMKRRRGPTLIFASTSLCHSAGVSRIAGRAACATLLGPKKRLAHTAMPSLTLSATWRGSCSAIQPKRQPGRRKRLDRPERVMMGTASEREAKGMKGPDQV